MAYIGIGYSGEISSFMRDQVNKHMAWLKGDRVPRFFGDNFVVLYDSNTAREFVARCRRDSVDHDLTVYTMSNPSDV